VSKISYNSLKIKPNKEPVDTFNFNGQEISVIDYISLNEKYALVESAIISSTIDGELRDIVFKARILMYLVELYTNINFTEKQLEDEIKLYDSFEQAGFFELLLKKIPRKELELIWDYADKRYKEIKNKESSIYGIVKKIFSELPQQKEQIQKLLEGFDKEKYDEVINFVKAINNGKMPNLG